MKSYWPFSLLSTTNIEDRTAPIGIVLVVLFTATGSFAQEANSKGADAYRARRASRPAAASVQINPELASQAAVEFKNPPELTYQDFNDLVLQPGIFATSAAAGSGLPESFELLCYNGQPVGPTIRVHRGTTFHIHLKNSLPNVVLTSGHEDSSEQPHDLCVTNLHTHGLHVSPEGISDNIFIDVKPQEEFTFEYTVPADHPSGTYWYHPHRHGSVAYQLSNGLAGALIVEGSPNDAIPDLDDVPEIRDAEERILVFQLYDYRVDPPGPGGVGRIDAKIMYDVPPDVRSCPAIAVPDQDPTKTGELTAINGLINPVIRLRPGEVQRWRLIHAAWDENRRLYLTDSRQQPAVDMQFYEIAVDGMATGLLSAKDNDSADKSAMLIEIAPGQRSDVLIQAPKLHNGEAERIYYLSQSGRVLGPGEQPVTEDKILAKIIIGGSPKPMQLPDPAALTKCKPFRDIQDSELATANKSEIAQNGLKFVATQGANKHFWINGKTFTQYKSPVQIRTDTAEEWRVSAFAQNHPFHIHVNPFEVIAHIDASGKSTPMNVWRDTLFIQEGESYVVRSRFKDFVGKTVIHCHFLDHEDQGMMMPIEFIPPFQQPKPAQFAQVGKLTPTNIQAPDFSLADSHGIQHELKEFRPKNVVLVFFLGIQCSHCSQQLTALVEEAAKEMGSEVEIVAVSSRPISNFGLLPIEPGQKVTLLIDDKQEVFRSFQCYKDGPKHGLYVIDGGGVIRASYSGATPFDDLEEVAEKVKSLSQPRDR
jgi:FtsP/CotA-like multicopper oxidase with cupredoxin domain/peroxiredoxin